MRLFSLIFLLLTFLLVKLEITLPSDTFAFEKFLFGYGRDKHYWCTHAREVNAGVVICAIKSLVALKKVPFHFGPYRE